MLSIIKKIILRDLIWFPLLRHTPILGRWYLLRGFVAKNILYGDVSKGMFVIGITGTDGKTTSCTILHSIITQNLGKTALISTAGIKIGDQDIPNTMKKTSLDIMDLYKFMGQAKDSGCEYIIIEVSSHGLEQYRFYGVDFNLGALTNISAEHMDYHKNIEEYANTKKKLFTGILANPIHPKMSLLPKDDEFGRKWSDELLFDKSLDYGINNNASLKAENINTRLDGTDFTIKYLAQDYQVSTKLTARFNIYNILTAAGIGLMLGIDINKIIKTITDFEPVNGRMNIIKSNDVTYVVDFAHTPKAFESLLTFASSVKGSGRLIVLFGSAGRGGEYKRPQMGGLADQFSDIMIITEDDSMSENTDNIIKQISKGVTRKLGENYYIINSRPMAIQTATQIARGGDVVLVVGKGHENFLYTNFGKFPHNDMDYLKSIL